jgi:hypothetical protein
VILKLNTQIDGGKEDECQPRFASGTDGIIHGVRCAQYGTVVAI